MRIGLALTCLAIAAFCVVGFAATFEPLERSTQIEWRIGYGAGTLAALAGTVWVLLRRRRPDR